MKQIAYLFDLEIALEIKSLRNIYPNLGKVRLYYLLKPFCEERNFNFYCKKNHSRINYLSKIKAIRKREFKNKKTKKSQNNSYDYLGTYPKKS